VRCSVAMRLAAGVRRDAGRRRLYFLAGGEASTWKWKATRKKQKVAEMADEVLARQARIRADRTGEPFEEAFEAVMSTEAGRQLRACAKRRVGYVLEEHSEGYAISPRGVVCEKLLTFWRSL
jgi:hypothetical protein